MKTRDYLMPVQHRLNDARFVFALTEQSVYNAGEIFTDEDTQLDTCPTRLQSVPMLR